MEDSLANMLEEIVASFNEEKTFEEKVEFEGQMLAFTFLSEIEREMEAKGMKRKELAKAVGKSPGYITQLFRGNKLPNLNILAAMGIAVGKQFNVIAVDSLEDARNPSANNEHHLEQVSSNIIPLKSSKQKKRKTKKA